MSLRLYTSCNNQCNVINVVNHNHNNIEVLNDITDINGSPYYGENRILTDKDGNTMLQYNYDRSIRLLQFHLTFLFHILQKQMKIRPFLIHCS